MYSLILFNEDLHKMSLQSLAAKYVGGQLVWLSSGLPVDKTKFDGVMANTFPDWNTALASTNPLSVRTCPHTINNCLIKLFVSDVQSSQTLAFECSGPGK